MLHLEITYKIHEQCFTILSYKHFNHHLRLCIIVGRFCNAFPTCLCSALSSQSCSSFQTSCTAKWCIISLASQFLTYQQTHHTVTWAKDKLHTNIDTLGADELLKHPDADQKTKAIGNAQSKLSLRVRELKVSDSSFNQIFPMLPTA